MKIRILCLVAGAVLAGCKTTVTTTDVVNTADSVKASLESAIRSANFAPFSNPSTSFPPMTVFRFNNGYETPVLIEDDLPKYTISKPRDIALASVDINRNGGFNINASVDKKILQGIDVGALFSDARVYTVHIEWLEPSIKQISETSAKAIAAQLPVDKRSAYLKPGNIVVATVLVAQGIKLTILDDARRTIGLSVAAANVASIAPEYKRNLTSKGELVINKKELYYGYRPFDVSVGAAMATGSGVDFQELRTASTIDLKVQQAKSMDKQ